MSEKIFLDDLFDLTKSQKLNIRSNWVAIIGCVREHNLEPKSHFNKYGITHILRQIDSYYRFPMSIHLYNTLKKIGLEKSYLKQSERPIINRMLKTHNINDSIQIEHFNGGVKILIEKLIVEINKTSYNLEDRIKICVEIHKKHTACCYKLVLRDSDLNANTLESVYISRIYLPKKQ